MIVTCLEKVMDLLKTMKCFSDLHRSTSTNMIRKESRKKKNSLSMETHVSHYDEHFDEIVS
jgi:hypothetical protein